MPGRIPNDFIQNLLSSIDIVDVIQQRVPLKPQGREFSACCPFHNEKTPSFTVNREKQVYHCFGCGAGGSVISFVMEYENLDFIAAVEELAAMAGMEVPREAGAQTDSQQPLYQVLQQAAQYYRQQLSRDTNAIAYLKGRGLSGDVAAMFGLGFAPPQWDQMTLALRQSGASAKHLETAGLSLKGNREGQFYDRFRNRIMFPIRDRRGRTIAFGGRTIGDDKAKYLNSPETPVFHKSSSVYGLYETRKNNRNIEQLLVVEGYMDVVALNQHELTQTVATLGTAVNQEHLQELFKACSKLVFCFDGDKAGRQAAWRALKNALSFMTESRQVSFMFLPDGEDPDSYVRKVGKTGFEQAMEKALPFSQFFYERLTEGLDLSVLDNRSVLASLAEPLLSHIPTGPFRQLMYQQLHKLTGYKSKSLSTITDSTPMWTPKSKQRQLVQLTPIRRAISLLLEHPSLGAECDLTKITKLDVKGATLLRDLISLLQQQPTLNTASILEHWRNTDVWKPLEQLCSSPRKLDIEEARTELMDTMQLLAKEVTQKRIKQLQFAANNKTISKEEILELNQLLMHKRINGGNQPQE